MKGSTNFFRVKLSCAYILIFFFIFFIARLALYISAKTFFSSLNFSEIIYAFIHGLRFDALVISTFCGLFLMLINIPANSKKLIKISCIFLNTLLIIFSFLLAADIIYFNLFAKHLTTELLLIGDHFTYFVSLALGDYLPITIAIVVLTAAMFYFSFKIINKKYVPAPKGILKNSIILVTLGFLIALGIRGGLNKTPLDMVEAFAKGKHIAGELILNGVFTTYESVRDRRFANKIDISFEDALKNVQDNLLIEGEEVFVDSQYPIMRKRIKFNVNAKGYNVVIILLESWQKDYIDSLAGSNYGLTPNFDAIAKDAVIFDRFYANGPRSLLGLMSIFYSLPFVKGIPYMSHGLENFGLTRLPILLDKYSYDNVFVAGDKREADKAYYTANYLGFKNAYFKEDIPLKHDYVTINKGYDIEAFEFLFDKLNDLSQPFFGFLFTTTTHIPYAKTVLKSLEKIPEDGSELTGYKNRLYYSDYALGRFFEAAKKQPWFNKTVFILLADHQAYMVGRERSVLEKTKVDRDFKIPMIIYAPALFKHEIRRQVGAQTDILPTIIDILNIENPYSSMGKSLFSKDKNRFVFLSYEGDQVYLVSDKSVVSKNWQDSADENLDMNQEGVKLLFSIEKVVHDLIVSDRWYNKKLD
ncbi:MAG: LTA synthase family protein [Elusimicrobiota bacterium]|jgi:phosphoglycerol transferase MdoB-like AlkP superfamily enzyme|nr:LTA synthase family protein [Elusimicrobiota bacterium]